MSIVYRCKCCAKTHLAPTQVFQEAAFHSLQMQSYFENTRYFCPSNGDVRNYSFDDHQWVNEMILPKLCGYIMQWLEEKGQTDQILHQSEGELLSPEEMPSHLPPSRNALPSGQVLSPSPKSHVTPKIDHSPLRKMMAG